MAPYLTFLSYRAVRDAMFHERQEELTRVLVTVKAELAGPQGRQHDCRARTFCTEAWVSAISKPELKVGLVLRPFLPEQLFQLPAAVGNVPDATRNMTPIGTCHGPPHCQSFEIFR